MSIRRKVLSNVFYNFFSIMTVSISGYLFWIITGKFLVPEDYGLLSLIVAMYGFLLPIACWGLNVAVRRFIPIYQAKGKDHDIRDIVTYSLMLTATLSVILGILATSFVMMFNSQLGISAEHLYIFYLLTPFVLFGALMHTVHGSLIGLQRFKQMFYSNIAGNTLRVLLTLSLLFLLFGSLGAVIGFMSWPLVAAIIAGYYLYKHLPKRKNSVNKRELLSYGTFAMLFGVMFFVLAQGSLLYLTFLSNLESVAFFRVAVLFGTVIQLAAMSLMPGIAPLVSSFWSEGQRDKVKLLLEMSVKYMLIITLPLTALILAFPDFIIKLFYRVEYLPAVPYLTTYLLGSILWSLFFLIVYFLYHTDEPKKFLYLATISAVLNTALAFILVPIYGGPAASDSFLISQIVVVLIGFLWVRKKFGATFSKAAQITLSTIVFLAILYASRTMITEIPYIILVVAFGLIAYSVLLLKLKTFDKNDIMFLDTVPDYPMIKDLKAKFKHLIEKRI